jgi:hypothetical protein
MVSAARPIFPKSHISLLGTLVIAGAKDLALPYPTYSLHRGRSQCTVVKIIPDAPLYRIEWPDIGLSDHANLTRCKQAAREWAERNAVTKDRKSNAARRLKSLNNFWWLSSYVSQNVAEAA